MCTSKNSGIGFGFTVVVVVPPWSMHNFLMMETPHVASSLSTDAYELKLTSFSAPSPIQSSWNASSSFSLLIQLLCYLHNHSYIDKNSSQLWTAWLVAKLLLWNVLLAKHCFSALCPLLSSCSTQLFEPGASCNIVWHISWCPNPEAVTCLSSLVDNTQLLHSIEMTYVADQWHSCPPKPKFFHFGRPWRHPVSSVTWWKWSRSSTLFISVVLNRKSLHLFKTMQFQWFSNHNQHPFIAAINVHT
jgi:hypothetical protein